MEKGNKATEWRRRVDVTLDVAGFVNAIEKNNIKPVIDSIFPLKKVQDAFHRFKSGKAFGKMVVSFKS